MLASRLRRARLSAPARGRGPDLSADDDPHEHHNICAIVLAAGRGTRMGGGEPSAIPKVLRPLAGRAMAAHILHALAECGVERAVVVIPPGERGEQIESALRADAPPSLGLAFAVQQQPTGTADAVLAARAHVSAPRVLLVNGDLGLLSADQLRPLLNAPLGDALLSVAHVENPTGMGRIVRASEDARVLRIVEQREASSAEAAIDEVNVGVYRFNAEWLWSALERLECAGRGERYATDVIAQAADAGTLRAVAVPLPDGPLNIETPQDLVAAEQIVRRRTIERLIDGGALITDPNATWADATVEVAAGATIEPGCHLRGRTRIGAGSRVGPNAVLRDVVTGENCALESCTIRGSTLGDGVEVGPYSTIREGCELADGVRIGTHAELKNARLGAGVKMGHFSYLGDAEVGAGANIGAGAITCNYNGEQKHRTVIGEGAFIGSDSLLIAPLELGARARTGAGSVVTKDVPADGNAVGHPARLVGRPQRRGRDEGGEP